MPDEMLKNQFFFRGFLSDWFLSGALIALISYRNLFLVAVAFGPFAIIVSRKLEAVNLEDDGA